MADLGDYGSRGAMFGRILQTVVATILAALVIWTYARLDSIGENLSRLDEKLRWIERQDARLDEELKRINNEHERIKERLSAHDSLDRFKNAR